ncbi:MAG: hypothetical protein KDI11_00835 [Alphaproteobacteria bacterium]|nr:hypothetical protein [Alphaproteobacteria bacterium]
MAGKYTNVFGAFLGEVSEGISCKEKLQFMAAFHKAQEAMNLKGGLKQEHLKDPRIALTLVKSPGLSAFRAFSPQLVTKIAKAPTVKENGLTYIVVEDAAL